MCNTEKYLVNTNDGVVEVEELKNGIKIECLIEPSESYLQKLAEQPAPIIIPSETDILGQQLVEKDLQILELQLENQMLGSQIVDLDLRLLQGGF